MSKNIGKSARARLPRKTHPISKIKSLPQKKSKSKELEQVEKYLPDIFVTKLKNIYDKKPIQVPFKEIITEHYMNTDVARLVQKIQAEDDDEKRSALKKKSLAYILATFKTVEEEIDGIMKKTEGVSSKHFQSSQLLQFDIDDLELEQIPTVMGDIKKKIPESFISMISPSGHGVRFIIMLREPITLVSLYKKTYDHFKSQYEAILNVTLDTTSDPVRKWYYTHVS